MINFKNNKGITLAILIVTIIVVVIIAGITIDLSIDSINLTIENQDTSEMLMIQHAVQERYIEYKEKNDTSLLVGAKDEEGDEYIISSNQTLADVLEDTTRDYYIAIKKFSDGSEEKILYYMDEGTPKELVVYKNTIKNTDEELDACTEGAATNNWFEGEYVCKKINDIDKININGLVALGITGQDVINSEFEVIYETGYVKKVGSSAPPLTSYTKWKGETTSEMIEIDEH